MPASKKKAAAKKPAHAIRGVKIHGRVCLNCVVKRRGHVEEFDERKVYASVYDAAASCHYGAERAEQVADKVTALVVKKFAKAASVDSQEIFNFVIGELNKLDPEVGFMYETHRDIS